MINLDRFCPISCGTGTKPMQEKLKGDMVLHWAVHRELPGRYTNHVT